MSIVIFRVHFTLYSLWFSNRHPDTLPAIMSPLYVVGMLGLLMKIAAPMCAPTEYTIYIERQECNYCVAVNTTICMGFCFSWVSSYSLCEEKWGGYCRELNPRRDASACKLWQAEFNRRWYLSLFSHTSAKPVTFVLLWNTISTFLLHLISFWVPQKKKHHTRLKVNIHFWYLFFHEGPLTSLEPLWLILHLVLKG